MKWITATAVVLTLALAPAAWAGGWATVGLATQPDDPTAGKTQRITLTVLRHGMTPTDGAAPAVVLTSKETGKTLRFRAKPTGKTGEYAAAVTWPAAGSYAFAIDDGLAATRYGMSQTHTFKDVAVAGSSGSGFDVPMPAIFGVALAAMLAVAALFVRRVRARPQPAAG